MRRGFSAQRFTGLAAAVLLVAASIGLVAAEKEGSSDITLKGEVLDMACYLGHGAKGPDHAKCALKCARMGQPIGLLSSEGKVYLLVADHDDPSSFEQAKNLAGQMVTMSGTLASRDGINSLTVHSVTKG